MKDPKRLIITILLVAGTATSVQSQFNYDDIVEGVQGLGEGAKDSVQNWGREVLDKINRLKDKAMQKFMDELPYTVKEWIGKNDYTNANVDEMLDNIPKKAWYAMKLEPLLSMGKEKFDMLLKDGEGNIPPTILEQLRRIKMSNVTRDEALAKLKEEICRMGEGGDLCTLPKGMLILYFRKLGDIRELKVANLTELGNGIFNMPMQMMRMIKNQTALNNIAKQLRECLDPNPPTQCPQNRTVKCALKMLNMKVFGKPNTWSAANITALGGVSVLSVWDIRQLSPQTIKDIKSMLIERKFKPKEARVVVKVLAKAENVKEMSAAEVKTWLDNLGTLKKYVYDSDLPAAALNDETIKTTVLDNIKSMANINRIPIKRARFAFKSLVGGKSPMDMTENDVKNAGMLLEVAECDFMKKLTSMEKIKGDTLKNLSSNFELSGPGSKCQARTLITASKQGSGTDLIPNLVPFASVGDIDAMSDEAIQKYVEAAPGKNWKLTPGQKEVILSKVSDTDMADLPPSIKAAVPTSKFTEMKDKLGAFSQGMPCNSPAKLKLAKDTYRGKDVITASDIPTGEMDSAECISASDADKINESEITEALEKFTMAANPPSMDVCRKLKNKMVQAAMNEKGVKEDEEVAQLMTGTEVEKTPPCVVAALGKEAVKALMPEGKMTLMKNMGMKDNTISIPRKIRQLILEEGMKSMNPGHMIMGELLIDIGMADTDLSAENLRNLDSEDAVKLVLKMEKLFASWKKPCLDASQRMEIARMLEDINGKTSMWDDIQDRCCLLEVLSSSQLNDIPEDVLSSCTCDPDIDGFKDLVDAKENLCKAAIGENAVKANKKAMMDVKSKQIKAALNTLGDLNASKRKKRAAEVTACQKATVGGAAVLTTNEITGMSNESILACMLDLTEHMMDKAKARTVFERIKLAKDDKLDTLTIDEMKNLKYAWAGLKATEVKDLPTLTYGTHDEVVLEMGGDWNLEEDVIMELAKKILKEWRPAKNMEATDILYANQLICGFNSTTIDDIPTSAVRGAMSTLNSLEDCPDLVTQDLAKKAVAAYGDIESWEADTVNEMGSLIGGLKPEELMKIPAEAIGGLSVSGIKSIPPDSIKAIKVDQVKNFPSITAMALSSDQKAQFNDEMLDALKDILDSVDSGVAGVTASLVMSLVVAAVMLVQ